MEEQIVGARELKQYGLRVHGQIWKGNRYFQLKLCVCVPKISLSTLI